MLGAWFLENSLPKRSTQRQTFRLGFEAPSLFSVHGGHAYFSISAKTGPEIKISPLEPINIIIVCEVNFAQLLVTQKLNNNYQGIIIIHQCFVLWLESLLAGYSVIVPYNVR